MKRTLVLSISILAAMNIGKLAASGDLSSTIAELLAVADEGDRQAQLVLGMRYREGTGVPRDYKEALKWYRKCADQGSAEGMDNVGFMYLRGWGVPENFNIAAAYFKASAAENHDQALFNLGNCYFSGQGVEQDYDLAIDSWRRAAEVGHDDATWRLATLYAAGEALPRNRKKAEELCERIAEKGHPNGVLLLGELYATQGKQDAARKWWANAAKHGSAQASALLEFAAWRYQDPVAGSLAYVEVDHLHQGWNNCGATSIAMLARHSGSDTPPYDVKRQCPRSPIGKGTDWVDLVAASKKLKQQWRMEAFPNNDAGFTKGAEVIRQHLDANRPVVIDFTITRERNGKEERHGHTLLVVGYNSGLDQFVLKNPNQPPPGIQLMSAKELKSNWYSGGYSRLAKGRPARPLIVIENR
ncbi:MAG: C39 family peptidase [Pseudomonadota bacterium]